MSNPYQAPQSSGNAAGENSEATTTVITGQKLLMYAILGYFGAMGVLILANSFLDGTPEEPAVTTMFGVVLGLGLVCGLASAVCACVGIFQMGKVLFPGSTRYIYAIGVLVPAPLIGLIVMFVANSSANRYLKARGYKIGLLGAKR